MALSKVHFDWKKSRAEAERYNLCIYMNAHSSRRNTERLLIEVTRPSNDMKLLKAPVFTKFLHSNFGRSS